MEEASLLIARIGDCEAKEAGNMWHVKKSVLIDRRVGEVHQFATNPKHWYQWYAGLSEAENLKGKGAKGTSMDLMYFFFGRSLELHVLVVENTAMGKGFVWRCLISGAFEGNQTWRYVPVENRTEVQFEMDYDLPGSIFGKMANTLYIKKLMNNSMEQTLQNLKDISESE